MAYDVFLVYANEDKDMADLIVRRLRALKFKVRYNKNGENPTFDAKDARDSANSQSMLVLWSENAVKSDWVRAAASVGHSRPGMLVQVGLDKTIPYEPFKLDKRFSVDGMTSRKTVEGFYQTVEELGRRDGRVDLREWMGYSAKQEDEKDAWLKAHPTDPLALAEKAKRDKKLGIKPAPAAAATAAASLAAASLAGTAGSVGASGSTGTSSAAARTTTTAAATATTGAAAAARESYDDEDLGVGLGTILAVLAAIAALLFLGWLFRSQPVAPAALTSASGTAIGNATLMVAECPAGQMPASLLQTLEAGPIENDTE